MLRTLGRQGVTDLITRTCDHAKTMTARLRQAGLRYSTTSSSTRCWCGRLPTTRRWPSCRPFSKTEHAGAALPYGRTAGHADQHLGWATTSDDISKSADAIIAAAHRLDQK